MFVEGVSHGGESFAWQFQLPSEHLTSRWLPFTRRDNPRRTFRILGGILSSIGLELPGANSVLSVVLSPGGKSRLHGRPWVKENLLLAQHVWKGGKSTLHSSTAMLWHIQNTCSARGHPALRNSGRKWEASLGLSIPHLILQDTWFQTSKGKCLLLAKSVQSDCYGELAFPG